MKKKVLKRIVSASIAIMLFTNGIASSTTETKAGDETSDIESYAIYDDVLSLPIEFIDYRADNMLFEYVMNYQNENKSTEELALTSSDIAGTGAILYTDKYGTNYTKGLVEDTLNEKGLPVYKKEVVAYVAKKIQHDLSLNRNDFLTTDFYEALKANLFRQSEETEPNQVTDGSKKYYFDEGDSTITNWTVETYKDSEDDDSQQAWARDGGNMKSTGSAGEMYYDFDVDADREWMLTFYYNGGAFRYEAVAITDGEEAEILSTGKTNGTAPEQWVSVGFRFNTGSATKARIKFIIDEGIITSVGSGQGVFYRQGDHYALGSYEESASKKITSMSDITTCFDYAYYMLNHYFDKDTIMGNYYGDVFNELELSKDEEAVGYSFHANFDSAHGVKDGINYKPIHYDADNKIIRNDESLPDDQKGFFPLSGDNSGHSVKIENSGSSEVGDVEFSELTVKDVQVPLEGSSFDYYLGTWNTSAAQAWVDPSDKDHIKMQLLTTNGSAWGVQIYRQISGLAANQTYEISLDMATAANSAGRGSITTDFAGDNITIPTNDVKVIKGQKKADENGLITITVGIGNVGINEILDFSHIVIKDKDGVIIYESPVYSNDGETSTIPKAIGIHEAEDADFISNGYQISASTKFSGGKAIGNINYWIDDEKKYISKNVHADYAGKYALKVVYSGGVANNNWGISVRTNGGEWIETMASDVNRWDEPEGEIVVKVDLVEGLNTVDITGASNERIEGLAWEWINIDYFEISNSLETYENDETNTLGFKETLGFGGSVVENYHYAMKSSGKFIYNESENLYFDFTGDDDVYLFVDGKLALDIGGAHFAVNEVVYLNDLKEELGMQEGEIYTFDFFYLERHTDYSNLRINTNISVMNSGATVSKSAYKSGYTGTASDKEILSATFSDVAAGEEIEYAITVSNISDIPIANLCFKDDMINVNIEPIEGIYTIAGMDAQRYFAEGNTLVAKIVWDSVITQATRKEAIAVIDSVDKLNAVIKNDRDGLNALFGADSNVINSLVELNDEIIGYKENTQITLGGFKYTLPDNETIVINSAESWFYAYKDLNFADVTEKQSAGTGNHITIVAVEYFAQDNENLTVELNNMISRLEKIDENVLLQIQANAEKNISLDGGKTNYGTVDVSNNLANYTPNGTANNPVNDNFVYSTTVQETVNGQTQVSVLAIPVTVHLYDVSNDFYVLDYGIPVDLNAKPNGIFENDEFDDKGRTLKKVLVEQKSSNDASAYGVVDLSDFSDSFKNMSDINEKVLKYTPNKFIEGMDTRTYTVKIRKNVEDVDFESDSVTSDVGVDLKSQITVMPANVIYYEDNFVNIEKADGTKAPQKESGDKVQSNDRDTIYGNDDAYKKDETDSNDRSTVVTTTAYYDENGVYHAGKSDEVTFTFTGTGFEIIGRTGVNSPILMIQYTDNGSTKLKVVNTQYANGELYQIPVFSVRDLTYGVHEVKMLVSPSVTGGTDVNGNNFYLDGIRIYGPSNDASITSKYLVREQSASFTNIQNMLVGTGNVYETIGTVDGKEVIVDIVAEGRNALLINVPKNEYGIGKPLLLGYTNTEDILQENKGIYSNSLVDYLAKGPNNEVYLSSGNAVAFCIDGYDETKTTVQIEAKRVTMASGADKEAVKLMSVYKDGDVYMEYEVASIATNTAMYYEIPLDRCVETSDGKLMVVIEAITEGENYLSISNLKTSNCNISAPVYGSDIEIDPNGSITPSFVFEKIEIENANATKDAIVSITVRANGEFDGKFDACFDTATPGEESTAITYGFEVDEKWKYWGMEVNADGSVTYTYSLRMPGSSRNMSLVLSHSGDEYSYKTKTVIFVKNVLEEE